MSLKIYTRTGDDGTTGLFGGDRVHKDALRIEVYGTIDELNAIVGIARTHVTDTRLDTYLSTLQNQLFIAGSDLATPLQRENLSVPRIDEAFTEEWEHAIDAVENELTPLKAFILPGGHPAAATLHFARTVCRLVERRCVTLNSFDAINPAMLPYLNRLSDLLFVHAYSPN
jgi:cob(I)alamin adenosyltransferase